MRILDRCCNGCDRPPEYPSVVLCKECLEELGRKMHKVLGGVR